MAESPTKKSKVAALTSIANVVSTKPESFIVETTVVEKTPIRQRKGQQGQQGQHYQTVYLVDDTGVLPMWLNDTFINAYGRQLVIEKSYAFQVEKYSYTSGKGDSARKIYYLPSFSPGTGMVINLLPGRVVGLKREGLEVVLKAEIGFRQAMAYYMVRGKLSELMVTMEEVESRCSSCFAVMIQDPTDDTMFCGNCNNPSGEGSYCVQYKPAKLMISDGMMATEILAYDSGVADLVGKTAKDFRDEHTVFDLYDNDKQHDVIIKKIFVAKNKYDRSQYVLVAASTVEGQHSDGEASGAVSSLSNDGKLGAKEIHPTTATKGTLELVTKQEEKAKHPGPERSSGTGKTALEKPKDKPVAEKGKGNIGTIPTNYGSGRNK